MKKNFLQKRMEVAKKIKELQAQLIIAKLGNRPYHEIRELQIEIDQLDNFLTKKHN